VYKGIERKETITWMYGKRLEVKMGTGYGLENGEMRV
jgi:hypothetical protein